MEARFFGYILDPPRPTTVLRSKGDHTCNKLVKGCVEYFVFPIFRESPIQYVQACFGTIRCTTQVHNTETQIPYYDRQFKAQSCSLVSSLNLNYTLIPLLASNYSVLIAPAAK